MIGGTIMANSPFGNARLPRLVLGAVIWTGLIVRAIMGPHTCVYGEPKADTTSIAALTSFHALLIKHCDSAGIQVVYDGPLGRGSSARGGLEAAYDAESLTRWSLVHRPLFEKSGRVLTKVVLTRKETTDSLGEVTLDGTVFYISVVKGAEFIGLEESIPGTRLEDKITLRQFLKTLISSLQKR
jgi:hypothetical protein